MDRAARDRVAHSENLHPSAMQAPQNVTPLLLVPLRRLVVGDLDSVAASHHTGGRLK